MGGGAEEIRSWRGLDRGLDAALDTELSAPYQAFSSRGELEEVQRGRLTRGIWAAVRFDVATCERVS